jgi:hypothetical protein
MEGRPTTACGAAIAHLRLLRKQDAANAAGWSTNRAWSATLRVRTVQTSARTQTDSAMDMHGGARRAIRTS